MRQTKVRWLAWEVDIAKWGLQIAGKRVLVKVARESHYLPLWAAVSVAPQWHPGISFLGPCRQPAVLTRSKHSPLLWRLSERNVKQWYWIFPSQSYQTPKFQQIRGNTTSLTPCPLHWLKAQQLEMKGILPTGINSIRDSPITPPQHSHPSNSFPSWFAFWLVVTSLPLRGSFRLHQKIFHLKSFQCYHLLRVPVSLSPPTPPPLGHSPTSGPQNSLNI